jgi:hypothetical protein
MREFKDSITGEKKGGEETALKSAEPTEPTAPRTPGSAPRN